MIVNGIEQWPGTRVRRDGREGVIATDDNNGYTRSLGVRFDDGTEAIIVLNNVGPDRQNTKAWEWLCSNAHSSVNGKWIRF